jgi:hypothetical protein
MKGKEKLELIGKEVFITKYALTKGILRASINHVYGTTATVKGGKSPVFKLFAKGTWHLTYKEARERAEKMRTAKIHSLKKSIKRLELQDLTKVKDW